MGRSSANRILTWVIVLLIIFFVGRLFVALIPYLLVGGLILLSVFKIKGSSRKREKKQEKVKYEENTYSASAFKDEAQGDVIDVDYEDV